MIRVLVVDDSAVIRHVLTRRLAQEPDIEVVGAAPDPYAARDMIVRLKPDVVTLDVEMPRMNGIEFLRRLMRHYPLPVIIVSSVTPSGGRMACEALALGAVDVLCKPASTLVTDDLTGRLVRSVRVAAGVSATRIVSQLRSAADATAFAPLPGLRFRSGALIAIGASTGGTRAIEAILPRFPANAPPTLIVQHMPPHFTRSFAERLNDLSAMEVREAGNGDTLAPGLALIAPGDHHMILSERPGAWRVELRQGPRVHFQRPAVEVTFTSVARVVGAATIGLILTGMGADGAEGLLKIRQAGGHTIAQDEASSVVFGMPRAAIELGAAEQVLPLDQITRATLQLAAA